MKTGNIGIRNLSDIGIADIDPYGTDRRKTTFKKPIINEGLEMALLEFKPLPSYNGEFGFDTFPNNATGLKNLQENVTGGFKDENSELKPQEAIEKLKKEFISLPVNWKTTTKNIGIEKPPLQYYVPVLTIFSEEFTKTLKNLSDEEKPANTITLGLEALIENSFGDSTKEGNTYDQIDGITIEYNQKIFKLDKDFIQYKNYGRNTGKQLTIKCLKDFKTIEEIKFFANPRDSFYKSVAEQKALRRLCGKLYIFPNDSSVRKIKNIALVKIKTDAFKTNDPKKGELGNFTIEEKLKLRRIFYQSYIVPKIVEKLSKDIEFVLDLSSNADFQKGGKYVNLNGALMLGSLFSPGKFIQEIYNKFVTPEVKKVFNNEEFGTIFSWGISPPQDSINGGITGQTDKIGIPNTCVFKSRGSIDSVSSHEFLHGIGLIHTHKENEEEEKKLKKEYKEFLKNRKYTFKVKTTSNIMAYENFMYIANKSKLNMLWYWQWKILNNNIKNIEKK